MGSEYNLKPEAKARHEIINPKLIAAGWVIQQYKSANIYESKGVAIGIVTEGCELLELFRSKTNEEIAEMLKNPKKREMIEDELADTFGYLLLFSSKNKIDLEKAFYKKLKKTCEKYPVEKYNGHWEKPGRE